MQRLMGEWDKDINAFWFGANNCEWVAWKGSHQILVYPCDEHPKPPSSIIQHTARIETLEDFTEAMINGVEYKAIYQESEHDA